MKTASDRRIRRSDNLYEALTYQIEAVCDDYGLSHLTLASDEGLTLAFSGAERTNEWLAAVAPGVHEGWFVAGGRADSYVLEPPTPVSSDTALKVADIKIEGTTLYLAGFAEKGARSEAGLAHASRGIRRIFEEIRAL